MFCDDDGRDIGCRSADDDDESSLRRVALVTGHEVTPALCRRFVVPIEVSARSRSVAVVVVAAVMVLWCY